MAAVPEAKAKTPVTKRWWFWLIIIVAVIVVIVEVAKGGGSSGSSPTSNPTAAQSAQTTGTTVPPAETTTEQPAAPTRDNSSAVAATLGAGTFTVGTDLQPGRYVITPGQGQQGNISVTSATDPLKVNEILGTAYGIGVPSVTTDLAQGDQVQIQGMSGVVFTPAETQMSDTLTTGQWEVGLDIAPGRYVATPADGEQGNLYVDGSGWMAKVNEILGGDYGVPSVTVTLDQGDIIDIMGLSSVSFASA
ncbi:MAG: hypothetical protein FWF36_10530 [Propionibacteriaceae bacterium]|nr:hypothetical protein [Propionibacteriaceae bacterium]